MKLLILHIVRFSKIIEIVMLFMLSIVLWVLLYSYIADMTSYHKGKYAAWFFYFGFIFISIYHFCFNNTLYNLRLLLKKEDISIGKTVFDKVNLVLCSKPCSRKLCTDYICSLMFLIKWTLILIGILFSVYWL